MTTLIGDLVRANVHGTFHSDVQLRSFRDPEQNLELAKSYIFTRSAQGDKLGSVDLLWKLCEAYLPGKAANRFAVIATYGHGKSHFAVAVANFFGKSLETLEAAAVLGGLSHALTDQPRLQRFKNFKEARRPFLVILLSGDEPGDLTSKFYRALEEALQAHEETRTCHPPFWFPKAQEFLERALIDQPEQANTFLQRYDLDLPALIDKVKKREDSVHEICRELCRDLYGFYPAFHGTMSLRQMVEWAADELCGSDGPFAGVLILFDEFSTFVRDYTLGQHGRAGSPLQDLLNGVENRREKAAFVAFAQHDPRTAAESTLTSGTQVDSILRELDRLTEQYQLKAVLEEVLDSYLKQDEHYWNEALAQPEFGQQVDAATNLTFKLFEKRYDGELRWTIDQFRRNVTKGSFPLHPTTTALFSTIEFRATGQPRSVLQFAFQSTDNLAKQPVLQDGQVNWVLPIQLVDYFGEMFDQRDWDDFQEAMRQIRADAQAKHELVLKAMLLLTIARVSTKATGFARTIGEFSGLSANVAEETLQALADEGVIRKSAIGDSYSFWPAGRGAFQVEAKLREKLERFSLSEQAMQLVAEQLKKNGKLADITVTVPWGNPQDWSLRQDLLTRAHMTSDHLGKLVGELIARPGTTIGPRGLVGWVLAESEEDVTWYREHIQRLLDEVLQSFGNNQLPMILMRPRQPMRDLLRLARRIYGLSIFMPHEIQDVGADPYKSVLDGDIKKLGELLQQVQADAEPVVPAAFRPLPVMTRISDVIEAVFKRAFHLGPGDFFQQYSASSSKLRADVAIVAHSLADDSLGDSYQKLKASHKVASEVVEKFLKGTAKWKVLDPSLKIRVPSPESPLWSGWQLLDKSVSRGGTAITLFDVMMRLLNPPYGYDFQTLSLLFTAWYGYNRHELELSLDGKLTVLPDTMKDNKKGTLLGPPDIVRILSRARISRSDPTELEKAIEMIVQTVEQRANPIPAAEAGKAIVLLQQFRNNEQNDEAIRRRVQKAEYQIAVELKQARDYDRKSQEIRDLATGGMSLEALLKALSELGDLQKPTLVLTEGLQPAKLRELLLQRIRVLVDDYCRRNESLTKLTEFQHKQRQLQHLKKLLAQHDLIALVGNTDQALICLQDAYDRLEREQTAKRKDEALLAGIREMIVGPGTGLSIYKQYSARLGALQSHTDVAREKLAVKRQQVEGEIQKLVQFVSGLSARIDQATTLEQIRMIRNETLERRALYTGTDEGKELERISERCAALERAFAEADRLRNAPFDRPKQLSKLEAQADQLLEEFAAELSEPQQAAIANVKADLAHRADEKTREAVSWVDDRERELEAEGDPHELKERLKQVPAFLPTDERPRIADLRRRLQDLFVQDAERQVEYYFNQIGDSSKQLALLGKLMQLIGGVKLQ